MARSRGRRIGPVVALALCAAVLVACSGVGGAGRGAAETTPARAPSATAATSGAGVPTAGGSTVAGPLRTASGARPSAVGVDQQQRSSVVAVSLLATLPTKGRAPRTGYTRSRFGVAWTDDTDDPLGHNGCDTRNDILRRDLSGPTLRAGSRCVVLAGVLYDPYTTTAIPFRRGESTSTAVQIDHVVPLGDAWQTGAQRLTDAQRTELANDPLELLAVDGSTNETKGDGDAATWLPPNKAYRCAYVARQIAVKAAYRLWVTAAERAAMVRVLGGCPGQTVPQQRGQVPITLPGSSALPGSGAAPGSGAVPTAAPVTLGTSPAGPAGCTTTASGHCIRGGQLCPRASFGRTGRDAAGNTYVCTGDADRPHWETR